MKNLMAVLALLLLPCSSRAQDDAAKVLIELDRIVPVKSPIRMVRTAPTGRVNWDRTADRLGELLDQAAGTRAEGVVLYYLGNALFNANRIDEALATFEDLKTRFQKHPLVRLKTAPDKGSLVDDAMADCSRELAFRKKHVIKTLPEPVLDDSLTAVMHFTSGDVEVQFYKNAAPEHRKNFLKLIKQGFYDKLCVHRVDPDQSISFGCPNTRNNSYLEWGRGGPGWDLPNEFSRVFHEPGVLTSATSPRAGRSHGSQFNILLKPQPTLDFVQTPFARVVKGMDVVRRVSVARRNQYRAPLKREYLKGVTLRKK